MNRNPLRGPISHLAWKELHAYTHCAMLIKTMPLRNVTISIRKLSAAHLLQYTALTFCRGHNTKRRGRLIDIFSDRFS